MTAEIIDGKAIAESLRNRLAEKIAGWQVKPYLAVILVGSDPASIIYDRNKQKAAQALGLRHLPFAGGNRGSRSAGTDRPFEQ